MSDVKCPSCGNVKIVQNVHVGLTAEVGAVGLSYRTAAILIGTEPLLADVCSECGTVTRLHVGNTKRVWHTIGRINEDGTQGTL